MCVENGCVCPRPPTGKVAKRRQISLLRLVLHIGNARVRASPIYISNSLPIFLFFFLNTIVHNNLRALLNVIIALKA